MKLFMVARKTAVENFRFGRLFIILAVPSNLSWQLFPPPVSKRRSLEESRACGTHVAIQRQGTRFKSGTVTPLSGDTSSKPHAMRVVPATGSQEPGRPEQGHAPSQDTGWIVLVVVRSGSAGVQLGRINFSVKEKDEASPVRLSRAGFVMPSFRFDVG